MANDIKSFFLTAFFAEPLIFHSETFCTPLPERPLINHDTLVY